MKVHRKKSKSVRFLWQKWKLPGTNIWRFIRATAAEGRSTDTEGARTMADVDAISGPTPPYGQPDQNWGLGDRPAITMSYHSAETYVNGCRRLPEKPTAYQPKPNGNMQLVAAHKHLSSLKVNPKILPKKDLLETCLEKASDVINNYVIYDRNSEAKTEEPEAVEPNPFGLKNMLGNAAEYCSDWYAADAYEKLAGWCYSIPKARQRVKNM